MPLVLPSSTLEALWTPLDLIALAALAISGSALAVLAWEIASAVIGTLEAQSKNAAASKQLLAALLAGLAELARQSRTMELSRLMRPRSERRMLRKRAATGPESSRDRRRRCWDSARPGWVRHRRSTPGGRADGDSI